MRFRSWGFPGGATGNAVVSGFFSSVLSDRQSASANGPAWAALRINLATKSRGASKHRRQTTNGDVQALAQGPEQALLISDLSRCNNPDE